MDDDGWTAVSKHRERPVKKVIARPKPRPELKQSSDVKEESEAVSTPAVTRNTVTYADIVRKGV